LSALAYVSFGIDDGPDVLAVIRDLIDAMIDTDSVNERQPAAAFSVRATNRVRRTRGGFERGALVVDVDPDALAHTSKQ